MVSWGVEVNDYGNAKLDGKGDFIKVPGTGVSDVLWQKLVEYAAEKGWKKGDYKKLNLPFENRLLGQPAAVRERMAGAVEEFTFNLLTKVFNAADTAPLAVEAILSAGSHDLGPKGSRIEDPAEWTMEKIKARAGTIQAEKGPKGDFSD
jgi:fructose-bisphosphate aldolase class II